MTSRCQNGMATQFDGARPSLSVVVERKRLAAGKALLDSVPEPDLRLADLPAEQHVAPAVARGEVEEPLFDVLHLHARRIERSDTFGDRIHLTLDARGRITHLARR